MQTPKSRPGSLDARKKPAPAASKTSRKLKIAGSDSDSSPKPFSKTTKDQSPRVADRRPPRVLAVEKKRASRVSELEAQITQLEEELKKAKDQLSLSEPWKRAQKESEDAKKQLAIVTEQLEETQKELKEISECEDARVLELRKISQDRDRAWQSELEAIQKQHTLDSSALASAINEMHKLKIQLDRAYQSEDAQAKHAEAAHSEIQSLRLQLSETLELVEKLKQQLHDGRESEARAIEEANRTQMQMEIIMAAEKTLRAECSSAVKAYNSLMLELKQPMNKVNSLEELVSNIQLTVDNQRKMLPPPPVEAETLFDNGKYNESHVLKMELSKLKNEVTQLRAALEAEERKYQDDHLQGALQIRNAYELVDHAKLESSQREVELEARLKECRDEVDELRTQLIDKENTLQIISRDNNELNLENEIWIDIKKSDLVMDDLKSRLLNTEMQLQNIKEENEMLKSEITREKGGSEANHEALALAKPARAAEQEESTKLSPLSVEADESCRKAAEVTEQLNAAQAVNSDMEAELRRLKVQCDQWRKAAEAATAMLSTGNQGKYGEKTSFFDYHTAGSKMSSPLSEDTDDESPKKKNGNMLRKISVLLKKGQK